MKTTALIISVAIGICFSCKKSNSPDESVYATDSLTIALGQDLFTKQCSGCHNFKQEGIGPQLGGITAAVSAEWIKKFIHDPQVVLNSDDERGKMLATNYKTPMPAFSQLKENEINALLAFLHTQPKAKNQNPLPGPAPIKDPIPQPVRASSLVVDLDLLIQMPFSSDKLPRTRITKIDVQPGKPDLFVVDLRGKLYKLKNNAATVYMDMQALKPKFINQPGLGTGFGSFAFHPDFEHNGLLYTTHTEPVNDKTIIEKIDFDYPDSIKSTLQWVVTEWKTNAPAAEVFSGESRELFRIKMVSGIHGVQEIGFDPQIKKGSADYGLLFIAIGDGGAVENGYEFLAHSKDKPWGTILRIDPAGRDSKNGNYGIPKSNPFSTDDTPGIVKEIFAYGFRNPHRFTWTNSGAMLAVNVGHTNIESINIIKPGNDYGWPVREGRFLLHPDYDLSKVYPLPDNDGGLKITYPAAAYDHDEGKAISGGFQYTGKTYPKLMGKYLFGDIPTGRLFFVELKDLSQGQEAPVYEWKVSIKGEVKSLADICGTSRVDVHFGKGLNGEMYLLTKPDGKIYRMTVK